MNKFLLALTLIPFTLHADPRGEVHNIARFLASPEAGVVDCGVETKKLSIKKGEVKIAYDCSAFEVPTKKVDHEEIAFYLDPELDKAGLIIRSRMNSKNTLESDVTIKFRPQDQTFPIALEKFLYEQLKGKSDEAKKVAKETGNKESLELKCEADVSYGPKFVNSCSLTTTSADLVGEHQTFAQMSAGKTVKNKLNEYESVQIKAKSWKLPHADFAKGISVEQWRVKNKNSKELCLLEVSAKFEVEEEPKENLPQRLHVEADAAIKKLLATFPDKKPSEHQGNKTGKAIDFARGN